MRPFEMRKSKGRMEVLLVGQTDEVTQVDMNGAIQALEIWVVGNQVMQGG